MYIFIKLVWDISKIWREQQLLLYSTPFIHQNKEPNKYFGGKKIIEKYMYLKWTKAEMQKEPRREYTYACSFL